MLSFQIKKMGNQDDIEIFLDEAGLDVLTQGITDAKQSGHIHLYGFETNRKADFDRKTPYEEDGVLQVMLNWCGG